MRCKFYLTILAGALATLVPLGTCVGTAHASVYLGNNFLIGNRPNLLSDVSQANAAPRELHLNDVVFGYQQLGQVQNPGTSNLPTGAAWVLFSFKVASIVTPGPLDPGFGFGQTFVNFVPTPAADAFSLQTLVPTLFAQTGLASTDPLLALEVNSVPNAADESALISGAGGMSLAMGKFNTGPFSTEFGFGLVTANNDFLTVSGANGLFANPNNTQPFTESGGATVLYSADSYPLGFAQLPNTDPANGLFTAVTNEVTVTGQIFPAPGQSGAPQGENGAHATDHATYTLEPIVPEPASIAVWSLLTLIVGATGRRTRDKS